jgi:predicted PurR-regulated permease PerM
MLGSKHYQFGMANISENLSGIAPKAAAWLLNLTTEMMSQLPQIVLGIFIFTAALYYFLTQSRSIRKTILDFDLLLPAQLDRIIFVVQKSSYVTLITTAVIGSVQASIVGLAAWFCGYHEFFLVLLLTFFMSLIPVIGAAPMAFILSALSFMQGDISSGIAMLITGVIAGSIDNILKPMMVSAQDEDIHPVISLVAVIGAVMIYGFPGLLLGPVLTQLSFRIIPILFIDPKFKEEGEGA